MGHIPLLSDKQMKALGRVLGTNPKLNLTTSPKGKTRRHPSYSEDVESGGGVILAKITGGTAESGYTVQLYANGRSSNPTGTGIVFLPEVALTGTLPAGSWVLAHLTEVAITGGKDE